MIRYIQTKLKFNKLNFHYSWVIMLITFFTLLISSGIRSTSGLLIIPFEQYFGWNRAFISFALAINLALYGLLGPFSVALTNIYGARRVMIISLILLFLGTYLSSWMQTPVHLTILWGIIIGIGSGLTTQVLGSVIAHRWFSKHKGLVIGIFGASGSAGQLVFLPLFAKLLENHSWKFLIYIISCAALLTCILIFIFMRDKPDNMESLKQDPPKEVSNHVETGDNPFKLVFHSLRTSIHSKEFWLLSISFFVCGASTNGLIGTHFIPACMDCGSTEVYAAGLLSVMGIFDIFGTTLSGLLSDRFDNRWLLFWYYSLRGFSLILLPFVIGSSHLGIDIFVIFYGLDWVATVPPTVRLCNDIFKENGNMVFGWIMAIHQIGSAVATIYGGTLYTLTGNYIITFISGGLFCLLASFIVLRLNSPQKKFITT